MMDYSCGCTWAEKGEQLKFCPQPAHRNAAPVGAMLLAYGEACLTMPDWVAKFWEDFRGNVTLLHAGNTFEVPFTVMKQIVAEWIRRAKIEKLESETLDCNELLGMTGRVGKAEPRSI